MAVSVGERVEFENYFLYIKEISGGGIALLPRASTGHVILIVVQPTTPLPRLTEIPAAHGPHNLLENTKAVNTSPIIARLGSVTY